MTNQELYEALRVIVRTYISEVEQQELLGILDQREAEGAFPPGKGVLACVDSDSNGIRLKAEHKDLWEEICYLCV
jgi:hypothetical protein